MTVNTTAGMLTQSRIIRGVDLALSELSPWQQKADGWTVELASTLSEQRLGAGNWCSFHFWKGKGHKGQAPTVADLIQAVAADANYLESEPEEVSYVTGKQIEHNVRKMQTLFGVAYWNRIRSMEKEELTEAFGPFS